MPDINLLKDTQRLDQGAKKPPTPPRGFELSAPTPSEKKGLGDVFRSIFSRKSAAPPPASVGPERMGLGRDRPGERILTEKRQTGPAVIPLPEDESFNVNLLTEDLVGGFSIRRKLMQLGLIAAGAVVLIGLMYGGLAVYERNVTSQIAETKRELDGINLQISGLRDEQDTIIATTKKTAAIKSLIDQHIRWTKFFERLEHYVLPSVTLGSVFTGDVEGSMTFSAKTDTYEHVAAQYLILEQAVANHDFIQSFSINSATRTTDRTVPTVSFTIGLVLEPSLLENTPTPVSATTEAQSPSTP